MRPPLEEVPEVMLFSHQERVVKSKEAERSGYVRALRLKSSRFTCQFRG